LVQVPIIEKFITFPAFLRTKQVKWRPDLGRAVLVGLVALAARTRQVDLNHDLYVYGVFFCKLISVLTMVIFHHIRDGFDVLEIKFNVVPWVR
jgi:hypothetical protein